MKRLITAAFAALLLTGAAHAQSINLGPGGVSVDTRSPREIRQEQRYRERERYERREMRANRGRDCRTVTTREETRRGVVRRTTRVCD